MSSLTNRIKRNDFLKEKNKTKQNKTQACVALTGVDTQRIGRKWCSRKGTKIDTVYHSLVNTNTK